MSGTLFGIGSLFGKPKQGPFLYPGEEIKPARTTRIRLDGASKRAVETGRTRLVVTAGLFAAAFLLVGVRLVDLMVLTGPEVASSDSGTGVATHMARADIVDRNGVVLATNLPVVDLYVDARQILNPERAARELVEALPGLTYGPVLEKMRSGRAFDYIKRGLTPREQDEVNRLGIPGLHFQNSQRRVYPQGNLFAHVVGSTDIDNAGIAGLEKAYEGQLANGAPLALTMDMRVQYIVREELAQAMDHFKASAAAGIVLDVHTGELLSMVSLPDYAPEAIGRADEEARFNRATLGVFEMGSVMKLFNTAMALESGVVRMTDRFDTTQPLRKAGFTIRDFHPEHRWLTVPEILIESSNIGSARMAMEVGTETQRAFLDRMGMFREVRLELPETGKPMVPNPWREINTVTISYGHGIAVTPLHVARGVAALINGGELLTPTVVKQPERSAESDTGEGASLPRMVISPETSDKMRALMRLVVTMGSGKKANVAGYQVGGKTGTAEKAAHGGYNRKNLLTTFVAAFPMSAPRYVVLVTLDGPKPLKETYGYATAGWNAAPTAGHIIERAAPLLGVFPASEQAVEDWDGQITNASLTQEARLALR